MDKPTGLLRDLTKLDYAMGLGDPVASNEYKDVPVILWKDKEIAGVLFTLEQYERLLATVKRVF